MKEHYYKQYVTEAISKNYDYANYLSEQMCLPSHTHNLSYTEYSIDYAKKQVYEKRKRVIEKLLNKNEER